MNAKTRNSLIVTIVILSLSFLFTLGLFVITKRDTASELKLVRNTHQSEIQAIQQQRDVLAKEKAEANRRADSLVAVTKTIPKVIYKNKIIYVEKIDSVLHLSSDKRVVYFTDRARKGFRHK